MGCFGIRPFDIATIVIPMQITGMLVLVVSIIVALDVVFIMYGQWSVVLTSVMLSSSVIGICLFWLLFLSTIVEVFMIGYVAVASILFLSILSYNCFVV